jgi:membrane-associated phospholipid phosphatase
LRDAAQGFEMYLSPNIQLALVWLVFHFCGWYAINVFTTRRNSSGLVAFRTALDDRIPFVPIFILGYLSGDVIVIVPLVHLQSSLTFGPFILTYFAVSSLAFALYLLIPTYMEWAKAERVGHGMLRSVYVLWQGVARPHNTIPSLHAALPLVAACALFVTEPVIGLVGFVWVAVVGVSSLFSKQHYVIDLAIGYAFGLGIFCAVYAASGMR